MSARDTIRPLSEPRPVSRAELLQLELAQAPVDAPGWQESLALIWGDPESGLGGLHRIGHQPGPGHGDLWSGIVTPDQRYRRDDAAVPIGPGDREHPHYRLGSHTFHVDDDGNFGLTARDSEMELDLVCESFLGLSPVYDPAGLQHVGRSTLKNHLETHGRARGRLRLGSAEHEIDALFVRDHSWGPRDWSAVLSHRWVAGTFGPDLSFSVTVMQGIDGAFLSMGVVIRDGTIIRASDIDVVVHQEADGLSHRGGTMCLGLEDGTRLDCEIETYDGWFFNADVHIEVDTICRVRDSEGRVGFCDLEVSNGRRVSDPMFGVRAATHEGIEARPPLGRRAPR